MNGSSAAFLLVSPASDVPQDVDRVLHPLAVIANRTNASKLDVRHATRRGSRILGGVGPTPRNKCTMIRDSYQEIRAFRDS
jgi:hypothetical protein